MVLRPGQVVRRQGLGVETVVDIAIERQHRLLGILGRKFGAPGLVARHVQPRQAVAQAHQAGNLLR
jgi:hypothetical protein